MTETGSQPNELPEGEPEEESPEEAAPSGEAEATATEPGKAEIQEVIAQPPELLEGGDSGDPPDEELPRMTLIGHLEELRSRIIRSVIALFVAFAVCFGFAKDIYAFLEVPILNVLPEGKKLIFLRPTDVLFLYMKVAALVGVFAVSPYLLYQVWRFIAPGLYGHERRYTIPFVFCGSMFFLAGGLFAFYGAFPFAIDFLITLGEDNFEAQITGSSYFSFLLTMILGMGVMFELPIFIFALASIGVVTPRFLMRNFRWAVLLIFVVAAVITPTGDPINLAIFAIPTIFLYLVGVAAAAVVTRKRDKDRD
ncbi:MAG: twin-arginine translocase subunit TatC [Acidobacteriota bacterium]|nr:twin-arginine translocase subunit TatC [Acidobacteriota bacterium]